MLNAIADAEEDPDDMDPGLSQTRRELKTILRNAVASTRPRNTPFLEMMRRDQMDILAESNDECCSETGNENNAVSTNASTHSRKRKSVLLDLDSEDELSTVETEARSSKKYDHLTSRNKTKMARVSRNRERALSDCESALSDSRNFDQLSEEPREGANKLEVDESDASESELGTAVLSDLIEDQWNGREETEVLPSFSSSKSCSPESSGSLNPVYHDEEEDPFQGDDAETRYQLLPPRNKNTSWKSNTSSDPHRRDSLLKNSGVNSRSSLAFVDPVTGSARQEGRTCDSPALISENEYLEGAAAANGWLIDDMPNKAGKRKRSSDIRNMLGSSSGPNTQRKFPQVSSSRNYVSKKKSSSLRQSSLGDLVVCSRPPSDDEALGSVSTTESSISNGLPCAGNKAMETSAPMRLRVKVKDRVFLIPCPCANGEDKTVQWLAEQVNV